LAQPRPLFSSRLWATALPTNGQAITAPREGHQELETTKYPLLRRDIVKKLESDGLIISKRSIHRLSTLCCGRTTTTDEWTNQSTGRRATVGFSEDSHLLLTLELVINSKRDGAARSTRSSSNLSLVFAHERRHYRSFERPIGPGDRITTDFGEKISFRLNSASESITSRFHMPRTA